MSHISQEARARAAETKKRRTRDKLILAADHELGEKGLSATVENIVEEAGVSVATFYSFYTSRNALCIDAFTDKVVEPLERTFRNQDIMERIHVLGEHCAERRSLLRAALLGRLEAPVAYEPGQYGIFMATEEVVPGVPAFTINTIYMYEPYDFVDRVARLLWKPTDMSQKQYLEEAILEALHMGAVEVLDAAVLGRHPTSLHISAVIESAAMSGYVHR